MEQVLLAFGKLLVSLTFEMIAPFNFPPGAGGSWRSPCAQGVPLAGAGHRAASSAEMQSRALAPVCHPALQAKGRGRFSRSGGLQGGFELPVSGLEPAQRQE